MTRRIASSISPAALARAGITVPEAAPRATSAAKSKRPPRQLEKADQRALFQWSQINAARLPGVGLLYAIPNAGGFTGGYGKNARVVQRLLEEGLRPGFPDIGLPVARGGFSGLYLELKVGKNKPKDNQLEWLEALKTQGYCATWAVGWQNAASIIEDYLLGHILREL